MADRINNNTLDPAFQTCEDCNHMQHYHKPDRELYDARKNIDVFVPAGCTAASRENPKVHCRCKKFVAPPVMMLPSGKSLNAEELASVIDKIFYEIDIAESAIAKENIFGDLSGGDTSYYGEAKKRVKKMLTGID